MSGGEFNLNRLLSSAATVGVDPVALEEAKAAAAQNLVATKDAAVAAGNVPAAVEAQKAIEQTGVVLPELTGGYQGAQMTQGLGGQPLTPLSDEDALALAEQNRGTDFGLTDSPDPTAQYPVLAPAQPVVKGAPAPNDVSISGSMGDAALDASLLRIREEQDAQTRRAGRDLLEISNAMPETIQKWEEGSADLDPKQAYQELESGLNEVSLELDEVRNYFKDLSKRTVDPGRFYANGGGASAAVAVAVGALSQAMLGPGAPNTALNIIESAVERDIRAQEVTLQNAQQSGQGMLQALEQSRAVLKDKHSALLETRAALRDDMVSKMQALAIRSNNATAMQNVAVAAAEAARKSELERAQASGRLLDAKVSTRLDKMRRGHVAGVFQTLKTQVEATRAAATAAEQAAAAQPATAPSAGLTSSAVAGIKPAGKPSKGLKTPKQAAGTTTTAQADTTPAAPPTEGQRIKGPDGQEYVLLQNDSGQLEPHVQAISGPRSPIVPASELARFKQFQKDFLYSDKAVNSEEGRKIVAAPREYELTRKRADNAILTIKEYLKKNPNVVSINFTGMEASGPLKDAISTIGALLIQEYRTTSGDKSALSIQDITRALGALPESAGVLGRSELRSAMDRIPGALQARRNDAEVALRQHGMRFPPPSTSERRQNAIDKAAGKGSMTSIDE